MVDHKDHRSQKQFEIHEISASQMQFEIHDTPIIKH